MDPEYIKELAQTLSGAPAPEEKPEPEEAAEIRELKAKGYPLNKVLEAIDTEGMGEEVKQLAEHIYTDG